MTINYTEELKIKMRDSINCPTLTFPCTVHPISYIDRVRRTLN